MSIKLIPDKMIPDYGEGVYERISQITGLKFKSQMKGSGIVFKQIFEMTDLISGKKNYLVFTNQDSIWFTEKDEFIQKFINWIKKSIDQLNEDYREVLKMQEQAVVDDNWIFVENERIGYTGNKQLELLNKMRELRTKIPDINKK
ncbi:conserved hypothetical protein [Tenacibaculum maritimum]|nr:conserved hypothetical protein [Tenacibaculum maritimum]CAA0257862.1 conserved hypothetical protein [Tenacibaculum maritimum]